MAKGSDNKQIVPVISIQSDWEEFLQIPHKKIWISCKFLGEKSQHGYIKGITCETDTEDFSATLGNNSLCVKFNPTNHLCRFIPPYKVYSNIHSKSVTWVDAAFGGLAVSVGGDNKLVVWDSATGEVRKELIGHKGDVYKCKLFPSGIVVLSGGFDMRLKIWCARKGDCAVTLIGHTAPITDFCFVERGRNIISVSKDGTAKLWSCGAAACIATILTTTSTLNCCCITEVTDSLPEARPTDQREFDTQNKVLITGSEDGFIYMVAVASRTLLHTIPAGSAVNTISCFPGGIIIAGLEDGRLLMCSLKDGTINETLHESNSAVLSLASFKEKGILVGRYDGTVTYCNAHSVDRIQLTGSNCDPVYSITVTDSSVFAGCRDGKIRRYKVSDLTAGGA